MAPTIFRHNNHYVSFHFINRFSPCFSTYLSRLPKCLSDKESTCQCRRHRRHRFDLWVGQIFWSRAWQPIPVFLPREFHGQRNLVGYDPWDHKESNKTERLTLSFSPSLSLTCCCNKFKLYLNFNDGFY